jgi:hypothetical protein
MLKWMQGWTKITLMRDDFTPEVKRIMAARTGNACSKPDCRALTSGPQIDQTKALNVGVAAHITGASVGGERYDAALSSYERRHADNGIWLCQTCAKLVDNDSSRFTVELLRAWKEAAEARALSAIGKTVAPVGESESQRKLRAILPRKGKPIKLTQMNSGNAAVLLGSIASSSVVQLFDCSEYHVNVGRSGNEGWSRAISLDDVSICFDENGLLELQVPRF